MKYYEVFRYHFYSLSLLLGQRIFPGHGLLGWRSPFWQHLWAALLITPARSFLATSLQDISILCFDVDILALDSCDHSFIIVESIIFSPGSPTFDSLECMLVILAGLLEPNHLF